MKFRKILATAFAIILISLLLAVTATATPYADIKIGDGESVIKAVEFDSVEYDWREDCDGGKGIRPDELVDTEAGDGVALDYGGNIGWTDHGYWVQWTVNVELDGSYKFEAWLASDNGSNEGMTLLYDGAKIGDVEYIEQEGWQEYSLYNVGRIDMTAGTHVIKAEWPEVGGFNMTSVIVTRLGDPGTFEPWKPKDFTIGSGKTTITAIDFDAGKYGKDTSSTGGDTYRADEDVCTETGESGYGNIGWISAGDWVQYTVKVQRDGVYHLEALLATEADPQGSVKAYIDDKEIGTTANVTKDGWQAYSLYPIGDTEITAGDHVIKVEFTGGLNFAALEVSRVGDIPVETEAPPPADDGAADDGADNANDTTEAANDTTASASSSDDGGGIDMIIIIIAAVAVVIIVVIVIIIGKNKGKSKT